MPRFAKLLPAMLLLACAGVQPKTASDQPSSRLGHFSSADGFIGMTIDRTGTAPKVQLDRDSTVVELFVEDALDRGEIIGHWMNGPDGSHWLYIGRDGALAFFWPEHRRKVTPACMNSLGVLLHYDSPATPLGMASAKGTASPISEKTAFEKVQDQLEEISVLKRLPGFKPEDSGSLIKIEEAFRSADPRMLVRLSVSGAEDARWAPASDFIGNAQQGLGGPIGGFPTNEPWVRYGGKRSASSNSLARHGGKLQAALSFGKSSRLRVSQLAGWPNPVVPGTPGFIWMVSGTTVIFVTLDGGRYATSLRSDGSTIPIDMGAGSPKDWPASLQHTLIDIDSIRAFSKGRAIPAQASQEIEKLDEAWFSCVNMFWTIGKKQQEKIENAGGQVSIVQANAKAFESRAAKQCEAIRRRLEDSLVRFIENRIRERSALYTRAKARFGARAAH